MLELELTYEDGRFEYRRLALPVSVGRAPESILVVKSWRVAKQHARLLTRGGTVFLEDLGSLAGSHVNGQRVTQYGPLAPGDEIIIGPCRMVVRELPAEAAGCAPRPDAARGDEGGPGDDEAHVDATPQGQPVAPMDAQDDIAGKLADRLRGDGSALPDSDRLHASPSAPAQGHQGDTDASVRASDTHHRRRLHKALLDALDLRRRDILSLSDEALRTEAFDTLARLLEHDEQVPDTVDREQLLRQVVDEAVGLGPLEPLLADATVNEIMVNTHDEIFIERAGRLERVSQGFSSEQAVRAVIDRIVAPLGRRVDESSPMVDARLKDGSRVNAVIPPIALRGHCLTIRKFPQRRLTMDDLISGGSLDRHMAAFLEVSVQARKSVLVSGGTGSGKTTLLNILSNCIPAGERLITIEDAAELQLHHEHLVSLESRPANSEGQGRVDIRDLVKNALRMRPDRIIVGECRGAEAFDMLAAMNTGHEGSLTTLHANSPRDALARLETMILMAGLDLPLAAIREHIASAIDLIVQQARLFDGRRLITAIAEVTGMEGGRIQTQDLFLYRDAPAPQFEGCGVQPECFTDQSQRIPSEWMNQVSRLAQNANKTPWSS
ncbi:MAG TPA: ATPase, T2SS/T4P/T4SS family [Burkholderiaceae bacterium]|nr:ATPase, T2SS/T4P/T4SS family [Burkholderiaceae bacterium]